MNKCIRCGKELDNTKLCLQCAYALENELLGRVRSKIYQLSNLIAEYGGVYIKRQDVLDILDECRQYVSS